MTDLRVWLLEEGAYENRDVSGIYATAEGAREARPDKPWKQDDNGCWYYSGNNGMDDCGWLYPMEVQGVNALRI